MSLSKWLFLSFFSIVESYLTIYSWWDSFQCHYVTIDLSPGVYGHHRGNSCFLVEMFGAERRNGRGTCISGCETHPKHVFFRWVYRPEVRTFFMFFLDLFWFDLIWGITSIVTCTPCATAKRVKRVLLHC